jgi:glycosyltransferase involved in cell wall biosynthesis
MRRHLIDDEGVAAGKLFLSYNGVDTGVFFPAQPAKPEPLVIGTVAALRPEKRLDLLVEAFARVRDLSPGMRLAIVGNGSTLPALQQQATRLGIAADCVFQPATADVANWLRGMDIFVLPSESEAFSNALLEAMACGCCPVGSRVGGTPELIADGERGLLFESGNAADLAEKLALLIRDTGLRRGFGEAAAACARDTFSIQRAVQRMEELYGRLLTRSSLESPKNPSNG